MEEDRAKVAAAEDNVPATTPAAAIEVLRVRIGAAATLAATSSTAATIAVTLTAATAARAPRTSISFIEASTAPAIAETTSATVEVMVTAAPDSAPATEPMATVISPGTSVWPPTAWPRTRLWLRVRRIQRRLCRSISPAICRAQRRVASASDATAERLRSANESHDDGARCAGLRRRGRRDDGPAIPEILPVRPRPGLLLKRAELLCRRHAHGDRQDGDS